MDKEVDNYNKHVQYCAGLMGMIGGGYNAAAAHVHGKVFGDCVMMFGAFFILFSVLTLITFGLVGFNLYPPDREPASTGSRVFGLVGMAVVGIVAGLIIENL